MSILIFVMELQRAEGVSYGQPGELLKKNYKDVLLDITLEAI